MEYNHFPNILGYNHGIQQPNIIPNIVQIFHDCTANIHFPPVIVGSFGDPPETAMASCGEVGPFGWVAACTARVDMGLSDMVDIHKTKKTKAA